MKYLLGLILSLIGGTASAGAIPFPACTINNQPVSYMSVPSNFNNAYVRTGKVHIAGSNIIKGRPVIDYNPTFMSTKPKEWNLQVILHECAHLKLNHLQENNTNPITREYDADCHSATVLKKEYGYKDKEFDIILDTMKEILPHNRIYAFKSCINR